MRDSLSYFGPLFQRSNRPRRRAWKGAGLPLVPDTRRRADKEDR